LSFCCCAAFQWSDAVWGVFPRDHPVQVFLASGGGCIEVLEPMDCVAAGVGVTGHGSGRGVVVMVVLPDCWERFGPV
jgi:hypothetical protein